MSKPAPPDLDDIRPLKKSEMEFWKGGAQPGPTATPVPDIAQPPRRPGRR